MQDGDFHVDPKNASKTHSRSEWCRVVYKITQPHQNQCGENKDSLVVNKVKCIAFMAGVVNCSSQTVSRTEFSTILKYLYI